MVARGACLDPARTGQIGRERAAEGAPTHRAAEQRTIVHRLERELLAARGDELLDLRERGADLGGEHELLRLVERHPGKLGKVKREIPLGGTADLALRAGPDDLQGLAAG